MCTSPHGCPSCCCVPGTPVPGWPVARACPPQPASEARPACVTDVRPDFRPENRVYCHLSLYLAAPGLGPECLLCGRLRGLGCCGCGCGRRCGCRCGPRRGCQRGCRRGLVLWASDAAAVLPQEVVGARPGMFRELGVLGSFAVGLDGLNPCSGGPGANCCGVVGKRTPFLRLHHRGGGVGSVCPGAEGPDEHPRTSM